MHGERMLREFAGCLFFILSWALVSCRLVFVRHYGALASKKLCTNLQPTGLMNESNFLNACCLLAYFPVIPPSSNHSAINHSLAELKTNRVFKTFKTMFPNASKYPSLASLHQEI